MNLYYILDKDKKPVAAELIDYAMFMSYSGNRIIAQDRIGDVKISTVFLGLDHRFFGEEGEPILFETMIFGGEHDDYQERYCTYEQAEVGHKYALHLVKNIAKQPDQK